VRINLGGELTAWDGQWRADALYSRNHLERLTNNALSKQAIILQSRMHLDFLFFGARHFERNFSAPSTDFPPCFSQTSPPYMDVMSKPDLEAAATRSGYIDPHKIDPDHPCNHRSWWKALLNKFPLSREEKLPSSSIPLTERNLTEFGNLGYSDEHDAFHKVRGPRKISVSEWIQLLP
jgi:hypothetical protein